MSVQAKVMEIEDTEGLACISDDQARFFLDNGYLILRGVVKGLELQRLQQAMLDLIKRGTQSVVDDPDYMYAPGHKSGKPQLKRIEYVIDKTGEAKVLLGHPFILRSVEKIVGKDLIPTWDSMVIKLPSEGIIVPWHRDSGDQHVGNVPVFNVDFYLDEADEDTCVWAYPGSHRWPQEEIDPIVNQKGFSTEGAVPLLMHPGDVLFHNIMLLHGSPANGSDKMRRVLYYEFRTASVESAKGPHVPAYIPLKQWVLLKCLEHRAAAPYTPRSEMPYAYDPPAPYAITPPRPGEELATYRYAHQDYWRKG